MNTFLDWLTGILWLIILIGALGLFWNGFAPDLFGLSPMTWKESITISGFIYLVGIIWHASQE